MYRRNVSEQLMFRRKITTSKVTATRHHHPAWMWRSRMCSWRHVHFDVSHDIELLVKYMTIHNIINSQGYIRKQHR